VDIEVVVSDHFLNKNKVEKGIMTLVDEERQHQLIGALTSQKTPIKRNCGGSACNSVVAASSFGSKTFYSGKVANDWEGDFFVKDLNAAGVDFHNVTAGDGTTGKCLVMITGDAERTLNTFLGVSIDISLQEVDTKSLKNSKWLYMEGYLVTDKSRTDVAINAMAYAKQKGVKTSLSLSDPYVVKVFSKSLKSVIGEGIDLLFCNTDEARRFTGTHTVEAAANVLKQYAKTFVITRGPGGSLTYDGNQLIHTPGVSTNAVDSNGAGDMFAGSFLYAISSGHDYAWAARFANTAAALVVSQFGTRIEAIEYISLKQQFNI
jgi:sugar/nucleoside kinase (ribokinase family)